MSSRSSSSSSSSSSSLSWMCSPNAADQALQLAVGSMLHGLSVKTIVYRPRIGSSRNIEAIIEYPGPETIDGLAGGSRPILDVYIRNDSIKGISSAEVDTGGDELDVPLRYGLTNQEVRIIQIVDQNKAMLHVRAQ